MPDENGTPTNEEVIAHAVKIARDRLIPGMRKAGDEIPYSTNNEYPPGSLYLEEIAMFFVASALQESEPGVPLSAIRMAYKRFMAVLELAEQMDAAIREIRERLELPLAEDAAERMAQASGEILSQSLSNAMQALGGGMIIPLDAQALEQLGELFPGEPDEDEDDGSDHEWSEGEMQ